MDWLHELYVELSRIDGYLYTIVHPNLILAKMLDDSVGLLLNVWFKFILSTTDLETGGDFVNAAAIQRFEPKVQLVADAALVLIALWASYRIMWGHGLFTQYTARFLLPETNHLSKMWMSHFATNLFMQPAQLFVLSIGSALEHDGVSPVHHLFALASLLVVFKVPGAMGGTEKAAHKLESIVHTSFVHIGHALAKA